MIFFQRSTVIPVFLLLAATQASTALADESSPEINFVTSIGYQDKMLSFDQKYKGPAPEDNSTADFSVHMPVGNISFTTSIDRVFLALKYEKSLTEASTEADETDRMTLFNDANLLTLDGSELGVEREDKSITLGFNVFRGLNLFIGYMKGETQLTPDPLLNHNNFHYNKSYLVHDERVQGHDVPSYLQTYTEEGPYIGFSYAWRIAEAGTLSASYAYADMNGQYKDNAQCGVVNTCDDFDWRGETKGNSIGLTWTAPLGESSSYFLDLRQQSYNMDGDDKTGTFPNQSVETEETMQGITAGLQFYF